MKRRVLWSGNKRAKYTIRVELNVQERKALIDKGCCQSVVKQDLVKPEQWNPHTQVLITCVHGDQRSYPVATLSLSWRGAEERLKVEVIPVVLGEDLTIGTDYEDFIPLLAKASQEYITNTWWEDTPYVAAEVEEKPMRPKLSRKQKQGQRQSYNGNLTLAAARPISHRATVLTAEGSFRQAQREDPLLKNAWQRALAPDETAVGRGVVEGGDTVIRGGGGERRALLIQEGKRWIGKDPEAALDKKRSNKGSQH
ncbi:hypothetical protein NDU88_006529 [Pleurodeles waltl]|uniref:Uncharacterized protein n=1 Tax=Pleurodeles waltl TaxID=8319 RepID=A0AAV7UL88_PLEWA|nr:hypothetical protein NDU88_006529 [Pleurodeles waltl]